MTSLKDLSKQYDYPKSFYEQARNEEEATPTALDADTLNVIAQYIKGHEGYKAKQYLDPKGNPTVGFGHLIKPGEDLKGLSNDELFNRDLDVHVQRAQGLFPNFSSYPVEIQKALVDGTFRGEFKSGQKTVDYINKDQWDKVPAEYINRRDYRESKNPANKMGGVYKRMDENAAIYQQYSDSLKGIK
jgi:GH24 family phage-related lysozyme (muramidase)